MSTDVQQSFEPYRCAHENLIIPDLDSESDSWNGESLPSYDEDDSDIRTHDSGPLKHYLKERLTNWPKHRYKKHQKHRMIKHQMPINYGSIHTKEIRDSLRKEKLQRKEENLSSNLRNMMEDLPKCTEFLSLDPQKPILAIQTELKRSQSASRLHEMKNIFRKT